MEPGGRNAAVHPDGVRGGRGKRGQSERAAANEDEESSGARKMGRPAFHPPPGAKGEGKGARSRAREGFEGGRGIEVGSVGSQPCAPTASLVMLFALSPRLSLPHSALSIALPSSIPLSRPRTVPCSSCDVSHVTFFRAAGVRYFSPSVSFGCVLFLGGYIDSTMRMLERMRNLDDVTAIIFSPTSVFETIYIFMFSPRFLSSPQP